MPLHSSYRKETSNMHHLSKEWSYSKMSAANFENTLDCVCKTFLQNEPLASHLQITEESFRPYLGQLLLSALETELSWIASNEKTGKVIGAVIATDLANDFNPVDIIDQKVMIFRNFFEKLWDPFKNEVKMIKSQCVHGHIGATLSEYQRHGILKHLYDLSYKSAREGGYKKIMGEATSLYSLIFLKEKPNFKELHSVAYKDYEQNEKKIFADMEIHEKCVLFSIPI